MADAFREARDRYYHDTPLMVRDLWGPYLDGNQGPGCPDRWQDRVLEAYDRRDRGISVKACHNPGKTAVAAWVSLKQALFVFPQRTIVTAPSGPQLWDALWNEILVWFHRLPVVWQDLYEVTADRIVLKARPEDSFISARTCRAETPEALQGVHCAGGRVLLIPDEASAIPDIIFEAGTGSMAAENATTLLLSNPTKNSGFFYDTFTKPDVRSRWTLFTVSHADSPRVSPTFVEDIRARYGEDSNPFRVRCLGEFPTQDEEAYIPAKLVTDAMARDIRPNSSEPIVWGIDCGRGHRDRTTICARQGRVVLEPVTQITVAEPDLMMITGAIKAKWDTTLGPARPSEIIVEAVGMGAGVADRLRELGLPARAINVSESPIFGKDRHYRLRDQLWGSAKAWLEQRTCKLPDDEDLAYELSTPSFGFHSSGEMIVEPKIKMKARCGRSPDVAEAFVMTFASDAATILYGSSPLSASSQPLKRHLRGIV